MQCQNIIPGTRYHKVFSKLILSVTGTVPKANHFDIQYIYFVLVTNRHSQRDALLSVLRTLLPNPDTPKVIVFLLEPRHLPPDKQGQERVGDGENLGNLHN